MSQLIKQSSGDPVIGQNLKNLRFRAGLSPDETVDKLYDMGFDSDCIDVEKLRRFETGYKRGIQRELLIALCQVYRVPSTDYVILTKEELGSYVRAL